MNQGGAAKNSLLELAPDDACAAAVYATSGSGCVTGLSAATGSTGGAGEPGSAKASFKVVFQRQAVRGR